MIRYVLPILILILVLAGCLSTDQRQAVIDDAALTRDLIVTVVTDGPRRQALLKELDAATTVEQRLQIRAKAREAATQPVGQ